ncbi:MAG: hypothetical protein IPM77_18080 [Crocinitomicaceae bacterium]|nr:hypothetical protein [Crocinitomicaceae bacterium]
MTKKNVNISGVSDSISEHIKQDLGAATHVDISKFLFGKKIGVSISESEDIELLGFSDAHQEDAMVEFARYLLVQGGTLIYGGDLRDKGYTLLFSELSFQYRDRSQHRKNHFINYSSYPIYLKTSKTEELEFKKNRVEYKKIAPPKSVKPVSETWFPPHTPENKLIWSASLKKMREEMNEATDARIFLGGRSQGYSGIMPGVLEEAFLSIESDKPTYLIGAFGGITGAIIKALEGQNPKEITETFQFSDTNYKDFIKQIRKSKKADIDYKNITKALQKYGMEKLSKNNGLTKEENQILFTTPHIPVMIHYVLKRIVS